MRREAREIRVVMTTKTISELQANIADYKTRISSMDERIKALEAQLPEYAVPAATGNGSAAR